jgi:hypothetical protein
MNWRAQREEQVRIPQAMGTRQLDGVEGGGGAVKDIE